MSAEMEGEEKTDLLYQEAKRTLDKQIERSKRISNNAHKLLRTYLLFLSAFGAILSAYFNGSSSSIPSLTLSNLMENADKAGIAAISLFSGIVFVVISGLCLILAVWITEYPSGVGNSDISRLRSLNINAVRSKEILLQEGYENWIENLSNQNYRRQQILKYAYVSSVIAAITFLVFLTEVL